MNRISKVSGHLESIKKMIERGEEPYNILVQLEAVKSAINSAGKEILKKHLEECLEAGDPASMEELKRSIDSFVK